MSIDTLFPGFTRNPTAGVTPEDRWLFQLREKYHSDPAVKRECGYGSFRNWGTFKKFAIALKQALRLWKQKGDARSLRGRLWDFTTEMPDGGMLLNFNERHQRFYLRNGLFELAVIICREIEQGESAAINSQPSTLNSL